MYIYYKCIIAYQLLIQSPEGRGNNLYTTHKKRTFQIHKWAKDMAYKFGSIPQFYKKILVNWTFGSILAVDWNLFANFKLFVIPYINSTIFDT